MAASSGFWESPGCAPSCNVPRIVLPHPHGNQNGPQFACIIVVVDFVVGHNCSYQLRYGHNNMKLSHRNVLIVLVNLFICFWLLPTMMGVVLATIVDGG
jgi:hypothetical protein